MTRLPAALLSACIVLWGAAAAAQAVVEVLEGRGEVVRLERPAASVFVGDPAVAGVQTVSGSTVIVSGVSPGRTNLLALDRQDRLIARLDVVVTASTDEAGSGARARSCGPAARSR